MTALIAKIIGPYLIVTGIGFAVSSRFYQRMIEAGSDVSPVTVNLSGAVHFVIGMIILVNHFHWSSLAESAVSLIGVVATLKGAALITLPELTVKSSKTAGKTLKITAIVFVAIGLYFCYVGFVPE